MYTSRIDFRVRGVKILNIILMTAAFSAAWMLWYLPRVAVQVSTFSCWVMIALFAVLYITFARIYEAFSVSYLRISEVAASQILSAVLADLLLYVVICILSEHVANLLPLLGLVAVQGVVAVIWSLRVHHWYFKTFPPLRSAVVYDSQRSLENLIEEYGLEKRFDILWTASAEECLRDVSMLDGLQTVFLSDLHSHDRNLILKYCVERGVAVYVIPRIGDVIMSGAQRMHMFHLPMLRVGRSCPRPEYQLMKRAFDVICSAVALLVLSPVMLLTALAVKLCDGGPVLYKQRRLTKNGKEFDVLKFRSMRVDAEAVGGAQLSRGDKDPRVTPVGRFIRKCRIDELPQLLNILDGDMSIVGPRPERPEIAAVYEEMLPEFRLRLQVKAGLTGYAQVYGKYNTTPYDKLQMDLMYIANPSFLEDLSICFATIKVLFLRESTQGVSEETANAVKERTAFDAAAIDSDSRMEEKKLVGLGH